MARSGRQTEIDCNHMALLAKASEAIADGDLVDSMIHGYVIFFPMAMHVDSATALFSKSLMLYTLFLMRKTSLVHEGCCGRETQLSRVCFHDLFFFFLVPGF